MKIINKKVDDLIPYINNPRNNINAIDKVASSIKAFGFKSPIIIDKQNEIICGHTRLEASKKLGLKEVPCIIADDLTEAQIKAFRIADNRVAEFSEWNMEMLEVELSELSDLNFDMQDFDFGEIKDRDTEAIEDDFDLEEAVEDITNPVSKRGQIYKLGEHRLMCGDSTSEKDVKALMDEEKADLLLTDPPYNVDYEGHNGQTIQNDSMERDAFQKFLVKAFINADAVMKAGAVFYIWHAGLEVYSFMGACFDMGWQARQYLIWNKNSLVMGRQDYQWKHEPCLYGWKEGAGHFWNNDRSQTTVIEDLKKTDIRKLKKDDLMKYTEELIDMLHKEKTTVIECKRPTQSIDHPTMKPIKLFDYQIKNSSKTGDKVLDLFGGSGTTIMACEQNKRKAYLMELDEKYVDVIIKRWEEYTGNKAELIKE